MKKFITKCKNFLASEKGVTAIEYAIVVAGIAAVVLVVFSSDGVVSKTITEVFTNLQTKLGGLIGSGGGK